MAIVPFQYTADGTLPGRRRPRNPSSTPTLPRDIVLGIAVVSIIPAIFWTSLAWSVCRASGHDLGTIAVSALAGAIALFLSIVCSTLIAVG